MNLLNRLPEWLAGAIVILWKDFRLELRNASVLGTVFVFVLSTLILFLFATGKTEPGLRVQAGMLWVIILFTAAVGLGRTFLSEEERGTEIFLRLHTQSAMVYTGKLLYSFLTILIANIITTVLFLLSLKVEIALPGLFMLTLLLGTLGIAGATTLLSALTSQTSRGGPLLPVLLFPLLIPLLLSVVEATYFSLAGQPFADRGWSSAMPSLITMVSFSGVAITMSIFLFQFVWNE